MMNKKILNTYALIYAFGWDTNSTVDHPGKIRERSAAESSVCVGTIKPGMPRSQARVKQHPPTEPRDNLCSLNHTSTGMIISSALSTTSVLQVSATIVIFSVEFTTIFIFISQLLLYVYFSISYYYIYVFLSTATISIFPYQLLL